MELIDPILKKINSGFVCGFGGIFLFICLFICFVLNMSSIILQGCHFQI